MSKRLVTESIKKSVAGKQNYKCANTLNSQLINNFDCPLYDNKKRDGTFGEEGYEIDHIIELCNGGTNDIQNLQALCLSCHRVKTKRFLQDNKEEKKKEKKEVKKKCKHINLDTDDFLKKFNLCDSLYKNKGTNGYGDPCFIKLEKENTYNILNEEIYLKRDNNFELNLIEFIYNHRIRNPIGVNVDLFLYFGKASDRKQLSLISINPKNKINLEYNHLGDFLQNLNKLFPDKFNCINSTIKI